jgi:hypothetical protein
MLLVPPTALAISHMSPSKLQLLGVTATGLAFLGILAIGCHEMLGWYVAVSEELRRYIGQRILFVLGTNPQFPIVPVLGVGIICWLMGRKRMMTYQCSTSNFQGKAME